MDRREDPGTAGPFVDGWVSRTHALTHPLRLQILSLLTGSAMTAGELARETRASQPNVSYHLRRLVAAGLIEPAARVTGRGGTATRFRYVAVDSRDIVAATDVPAAARVELRAAVFDALVKGLMR